MVRVFSFIGTQTVTFCQNYCEFLVDSVWTERQKLVQFEGKRSRKEKKLYYILMS